MQAEWERDKTTNETRGETLSDRDYCFEELRTSFPVAFG